MILGHFFGELGEPERKDDVAKGGEDQTKVKQRNFVKLVLNKQSHQSHQKKP